MAVAEDSRHLRETELILIGQYDSPFVRRVGIALRLYGHAYEHRPWSTFGDADRIAVLNPLQRVPTLVLDDGEVLIESGAILDHLDELAGPSTHGPLTAETERIEIGGGINHAMAAFNGEEIVGRVPQR